MQNDEQSELRANILTCLQQLEIRDVRARDLALIKLRRLGPEAVEVLHGVLEEQKSRSAKDRPRRWAKLIFWCVGTFLSWAMMAASLKHITVWVFVSIAGYVLIYRTLFRDLRRMPHDQRTTISALAEFADIRSIRYFIEATESGDVETHQAGAVALRTLLPIMTKATAELVPIAQRTSLYRQLLSVDPVLVRLILEALPAFDDTIALSMVEKLASGKGAAKANPEIRGMAAGLLPKLKARREDEFAPVTLLRPSFNDKTIASTALRPSQFAIDHSEPTQLLRSGSTTESDDIE